jgi:hypothetical protein
MKKIGMVLLVVALYGKVAAQIPNNGFENWSTDGGGNLNPDFWLSPNDQSVSYTPIERVTGYMSTYAMRVFTPNMGGFNLPSATLLQFASTLRPTALNGYYKGIFSANDSSYVNFTSSFNGSGIGAGVRYFSADQNTFTSFSVPVNYSSASDPDTISIIVGSGSGVTTPGADLTIDDFTFSFISGIEIPLNSGLITGGHMDASMQDYSFYIHSPLMNLYTIKLCDIAGHELYTASEFLDEGKHPVSIPAASFVNGIYILRVTGGPTNHVQKIVITH